MRETFPRPAVDFAPQVIFAGRLILAGVFVSGVVFRQPIAVKIGAIGNLERWFA